MFTDEDKLLLESEYKNLSNISLSNKPYQNARYADLNNKLVVLSGNYNNPQIHSVFIINAKSETYAEIIKDEIKNEGEYYGNSREQFESFGRDYQSITGIQFVGFYSSYDFQYLKGRKDTGQRAIYNPQADYYGYTKQFQDRTGNHTETTPEFSKREIKTNKGYTLSDNSRIIEINKKIVLLDGKYDNPVIYHVFVINATSENDARPVKEFLYDVITERKVGNRIHYCEVVESISSAVIKVQGRGAVRSFEKSDYEYNRGSSTWQRATLPSYFNHFGYTTKYQDRTGNHTETMPEFSKRVDADYLSAVERSDMETAQRMVDEAQLKKAAAGNACDSFCNYSAILISTGNQINLLR